MSFIEKMRGLSRSRALAAVAGGALVVLLSGGTAVAAAKISGDDIQHYSITKQHLKKDSVGSWEAKDRTLVGGDIKQGSVGRLVLTEYLRGLIKDVEDGSLQGEKGEKGDPGADGVSGYEVVANEVTWAAGSTNNVTVASCPEGKMAVGGGWDSDDADGPVALKGSGFTGVSEIADGVWSATGWEVRGDGQASNHQLAAWVACAAVN